MDDDINDMFDNAFKYENANLNKLHNEICEYCNSDLYLNIDKTTNNLICNNCGTIITNIITDELEQHNYEDKDINLRCGSVTNAFTPQASTMTSFSGPQNGILQRMNIWGSISHKELSLITVLKYIEENCSILGLSKCIEDDAKILYKYVSNIVKKKSMETDKIKYLIIRGINRKIVPLACIFSACNKNNYSITTKEISKILNISYKNLNKGYKKLTKITCMKYINSNFVTTNTINFIKRICKKFNFDENILELSKKYIETFLYLDIIPNHNTNSMAISIIILVSNNFNQKKLFSEMFNISEVTISKACKTITIFKNILLSDEKIKIAKEIIDYKKQHITVCNDLFNKYYDIKKKHLINGIITIDEFNDDINKIINHNDNVI